ncbi:hypothetical protein EAI_13263 [Harpegnathos saltator]|uniref:Uncharacterized protein n=1 Tax=Harpegnathos saltator TaxID=610380 RepID=E2C4V5_HARSA|nr:hypothetical protein EAI_13263 [Harpegnathos saltator]
MDFWTIVLSILILALIMYYYSSPKGTQNAFQQHGVPHSRRMSILQEILELFVFPKTYTDMIQAAYNTHRDAKYVGIFHLTRSFLMLRDLEGGFIIMPEGGFWLKVVPKKEPHRTVAINNAKGTCEL